MRIALKAFFSGQSVTVSMANPSATLFLQAAVAAFPTSHRAQAENAAMALARFADQSYRISTMRAVVAGRGVKIPKRLHLLNPDEAAPLVQHDSMGMFQCLCTRSTDGYLRQAHLRCVLKINEPWSIPFIVLLAGEYIVEIIEDMVAELSSLNRDAYIDFVRENRPLMRRLSYKATSYWNCYYRESYPNRSAYPGLVFLRQLETWAS